MDIIMCPSCGKPAKNFENVFGDDLIKEAGQPNEGVSFSDLVYHPDKIEYTCNCSGAERDFAAWVKMEEESFSKKNETILF